MKNRSREKITTILSRRGSGERAFWMGNPHPDTLRSYLSHLHLEEYEQLCEYLDDDCRCMLADGAYRHPEGKLMFDPLGGRKQTRYSQDGVFADCTDFAEVEAYDWPDPDHLDFTEILSAIDIRNDKGVFTGFWSHFFHLACDFFGMENYFLKMYTDPLIAEAVTTRIVDFFVEANDRYFTALGDRADILFIGNDLGSQRDLLISPECFDRFLLPGFRRLVEVAHRHNKKVLLHSCGSIYKIIPRLIDIGVDALNPLQALAHNMDAETLGREFGRDLAFVGGIDTQDLLVNGTPDDVRREVRRVRGCLGPNVIISPSHECLLPNIPFANTLAMAEAAKE